MSLTLPTRPHLDHLKRQAKDRLRELRARTPGARLADAQHALARDYGFASWPKLKAHVESLATLPVAASVASAPPPPAGPPGSTSSEGGDRPAGYGFTRYTERARRATFFSRWEAAQFGSRTIEDEHLLLGLLQARQGISGSPVLAVPVTEVRADVARRMPPREGVGVGVVIPFSDAARRALARAVEEADRRGHAQIGTAHLLLGLLGDPSSVAWALLAERGVEYSAVADGDTLTSDD